MAFILYDFDYTIKYRHGTSKRHVDVLSINPICMVIQYNWVLKIIRTQETDEDMKTIKEILKAKPYYDPNVNKCE